MRKAFVAMSSLLLVAFVLQFVFAAVGAFTKPAGDGAYALHSITGMAVIPALTLLTTLFAALAKAPGRLVGLAILPLGLVVVQALIAALANGLTGAGGGAGWLAGGAAGAAPARAGRGRRRTVRDARPCGHDCRAPRRGLVVRRGEGAHRRADKPGRWANHCHNLAHADAGMMLHLTYAT